MSMSAAQSAAFQTASGMSAASAGTFFTGLVFTIACLWVVWSMNSIYRGWATNNLNRSTAAASIVKLFVLLLTLTFFVLS